MIDHIDQLLPGVNRQRKLADFLLHATRISLVIVGIQAVVTILTHDVASFVVLFFILFGTASLWFARVLANAGSSHTAVMTYCLGILVASISIVIAAPNTAIVIVLMPIVTLVAMLPYTLDHVLKWPMILAFVVSVGIAYAAQFTNVFSAEVNVGTRAGVVICVGLETWLLIELISRFRRWLYAAIQAVAEKNELLSENQNRLEEQVVFRTRQLQEQNALLEQLNQELRNARAVIVVAREEERQRIRHDLHDHLAPVLAGIALKTDAVHMALAVDSRSAFEMLDQVAEQAQQAVFSLRRTVDGLRPARLDEMGLLGALSVLIKDYHRPGLSIVLEAPGETPALNVAVETALYAIAAEALHNVLRHAHAKNCTVRLAAQPDKVFFEICDDGCGLVSGDQGNQACPGLGIVSMRLRAEELGGCFTLSSMPHQGTRVQVEIPRPVQ